MSKNQSWSNSAKRHFNNEVPYEWCSEGASNSASAMSENVHPNLSVWEYGVIFNFSISTTFMMKLSIRIYHVTWTTNRLKYYTLWLPNTVAILHPNMLTFSIYGSLHYSWLHWDAPEARMKCGCCDQMERRGNCVQSEGLPGEHSFPDAAARQTSASSTCRPRHSAAQHAGMPAQLLDLTHAHIHTRIHS